MVPSLRGIMFLGSKTQQVLPWGWAAERANPSRPRPGGNSELTAPLPTLCLIKRDWPTQISVVVRLSQTHPSR